jgi:nicotinamide-nucleotide adenylyltransferase
VNPEGPAVRGLLVGRFQPFHSGHLELLQHIAQRHPGDSVILGIGSAQESYTVENPFTASERAEMIARALAEARLPAAPIVPIPDIHRHALWVAHVRELVPPFERVYTNNPLTRLLFERDRVSVESTPLFDRPRLTGTRIRHRMAEGGDWTGDVPPAVAKYLAEIDGPGRLRLLSKG